jgi:hypothetical protein
MRNARLLPIPLSAVLLLAWWGCSRPDKPDLPLSPSLAVTPTCNVTMTYLGPKGLTVGPNSANNNASWFVTNNGTSAATLTGQTLSKSGAVTAVRTNVWAPFPYSLAAGSRIDADLRFDVGASGTGSVGMTVSSSCGAIVAPAHPVTIQASATGIPYGLFNLMPNEAVANQAIWTASSLTNQSMTAVMNNLRGAQNRTPRLKMWFNLTAGDAEAFMYDPIHDHRFKLQAWKDSLDNHVRLNGALKPDGTSYYNDSIVQGGFMGGTLQGHIMLDDIAKFDAIPITARQIDSMAAYSKLRFPTLLTAVRARPTTLRSLPGGSAYTTLDVGWAQYRSDQGSEVTYRDAEVSAATALHLGLVIGININDSTGGNSPEVEPDRILTFGTAFLNSAYPCGFLMWNDSYTRLGNSVFNSLATQAANHVAAPCKRR